MSSLECCPALSGCDPLQAGPSHQSFKPQCYIIPSQSVALCIPPINSTMSGFQLDGFNLWSLFAEIHMWTLAVGIVNKAKGPHVGDKYRAYGTNTPKSDSFLPLKRTGNSQFLCDETSAACVVKWTWWTERQSLSEYMAFKYVHTVLIWAECLLL